jgi:hypothetical protein
MECIQPWLFFPWGLPLASEGISGIVTGIGYKIYLSATSPILHEPAILQLVKARFQPGFFARVLSVRGQLLSTGLKGSPGAGSRVHDVPFRCPLVSSREQEFPGSLA